MNQHHRQQIISRLAELTILGSAILPGLIYALVTLTTISQELQHDADTQAIVLSKVITKHPDAWQYAKERINDAVVDIRHSGTLTVLIDLNGKELDRIGDDDNSPLRIYRRASLTSYGESVGTVLISQSIHLVLAKAAAIFLICGLIGFAFWKWIHREVLQRLDLARTELENTLVDLRKSEELFRSLSENTSALVWTSGLDKKCNWFNKVWLDFTGRTIKQEIGDGWAEGVHPDDLEYCLNTYVTAFDKMQRFSMVYRLRRHDGEYRYLLDHGAPLYSDKGLFTGYIGTCVDITERRQLEQNLLLTQFVMENAPVEIYWLDKDARIEYVNRFACETLGYTKEELKALSIPELDPLFPIDQWQAHWESLKKGGTQHIETQHRRKDGTIIPIEVYANYVSFGGYEYNVAFSYDLTERKKHEELVSQLAFYDALTKLPNRRMLNERLAMAMASSKRSRCHGALFFLDLDNFKPLNDQYGHHVGDSLLIEVADRLRKCVREVDTVARFGGDEFVVVVEDLKESVQESKEQALKVAEKILECLEIPYHLDVTHSSGSKEMISHFCSASIGVTLFFDEQTTVDSLIDQADAAMYKSKAQGRGRVCFSEI